MACDPAIRTYCQRAGKALELPGTYKRRLLDGLERELEERFSSETEITWEGLCGAVGTPEESAAALMESVDEAERTRYRMRRKRITRGVIIALAVLAAAMAVYIMYGEQYAVDHVETTIIQYEVRQIE